MIDLARASATIVLLAIPLAISVWALLDAARRPSWAWSLAERQQAAWLAAILFGTLCVVLGLAVSGWYLLRIRPEIADAEDGRLSD